MLTIESDNNFTNFYMFISLNAWELKFKVVGGAQVIKMICKIIDSVIFLIFSLLLTYLYDLQPLTAHMSHGPGANAVRERANLLEVDHVVKSLQ